MSNIRLIPFGPQRQNQSGWVDFIMTVIEVPCKGELTKVRDDPGLKGCPKRCLGSLLITR